MKHSTNKNSASVERPDREGKIFAATHLDPASHKELRILAAMESTTVDGILSAALADYLRKHKRPVPPRLTAKLQTLGIQ